MTDKNCNPILAALDVPTAEEAVRLAEELSPHVGGYKVGLELLAGPGPSIIGVLDRLGKPVFADAKLHDIPNTVRAAACRLGAAGARWITVHAAGGRPMLAAAVQGLREGAGARPAGVLAVTVLTSLDRAELSAVGVSSTPGRLAVRRARLADEAGCEGVITSAQELSAVSEAAPRLLKVVPGIRPAGASRNDQVRTDTPARAAALGADYLVIGRAITKARNPAEAARALLSGLDGLLGGAGLRPAPRPR